MIKSQSTKSIESIRSILSRKNQDSTHRLLKEMHDEEMKKL